MQQWKKEILHGVGKEMDWKTKQPRDKDNEVGYFFFFTLATG